VLHAACVFLESSGFGVVRVMTVRGLVLVGHAPRL
jgi:hypothetical protein